MAENPLKAKGFVPGDMSKENYDRIDLHRPYVDNIVLVSDEGKPMKRETDLIDVWFDSGSMPYAQVHYPFENRDLIDKREAFPADFINEGVDQTRGWFFTLHAIATMIFDSVAFKNVISTGLVLDAKGNKMSKHVGNVVNPFEMIEKYDVVPAWIGYDPYSANYWVQEMQSQGFNLIKCYQGVKTLSLPMQKLGADLQAKLVNYNNSSLLKWCIGNTGVATDSNGNIKPIKANNAKYRIDGLASLLDAYVVLLDHYQEYLDTIV